MGLITTTTPREMAGEGKYCSSLHDIAICLHSAQVEVRKARAPATDFDTLLHPQIKETSTYDITLIAMNLRRKTLGTSVGQVTQEARASGREYRKKQT